MFKKYLHGAGVFVTMALVLILSDQREFLAKTSEMKRNFVFSYELEIPVIPKNAETIEIWIPLPSSSDFQVITDCQIISELSYNLYIDPEYGNRVAHFASTGRLPTNLDVTIKLEVTRLEQDGWKSTSSLELNSSPDNFDRYLRSDVLVPIDGPIEAEAELAVNGSMTPNQKIKALYHHLFETMKYDKSGVGWGQGDALYACESRQGNCTDIHSLFIGMARSLGIPSRFIMGFPLPEDLNEAQITGYHCWAEFYIDDQGWVPVDISEAIKHPEKKDYFFGRLDPNRVAFTTGRDIRVNSGETSHTLNYFIYPFVLVNGQPFEGSKWNFSFAGKN